MLKQVAAGLAVLGMLGFNGLGYTRAGEMWPGDRYTNGGVSFFGPDGGGQVQGDLELRSLRISGLVYNELAGKVNV